MAHPNGHTVWVPLPELKSPFARAVVPVLAGAALLAVLAGFTWLMAAYIAGGEPDASERLAPSEFEIGNVERLAETVATEGPLLFPELGTAIGTRSIVIDHEGANPADGWRVYWGYPADRPATCVVAQVPGTDTFTDCDGRTVHVSELALPDAGVFPRVDNRTTLFIDLRGADPT
jgi:hypothetical protein